MNEQTIAQILPALFAVLGVLGGAGLTAYINRRNTVDTLASSRQALQEQWERTHTREHEVWLRDQKQEAYMRFMLSAQAAHASIAKTPSGESPEVHPDDLVIDRAGIKVVGSPGVRLAARALDHAVSKTHDASNYLHLHLTEFDDEEVEDLETQDQEQEVEDLETQDQEQDSVLHARRHQHWMEALDYYSEARAEFAGLLIDYVEEVRKDLGTYTAEDDALNVQNRTRHAAFQKENEDSETLPDSELA